MHAQPVGVGYVMAIVVYYECPVNKAIAHNLRKTPFQEEETWHA